jgi:two-component system, NtrC family, sensor kinase
VAATGPGERAIVLPGFLPDAASLSLLAGEPPGPTWAAVRDDPGLLFFLVQRHLPFAAETEPALAEADLRAAAELLTDAATPWVDWSDAAIRPVVRTALAAAHFGLLLAESTEAVDPARAWAGGWLAYAGWLAIAAVDPDAVTACGTDSDFAADPFGTQLRVWGMRRAEIAWRLAAGWPLPGWAAVVLGRIDASPESVFEFGGDRKLQAVVQLAVLLAEQAETRLFVADEFDLEASLIELDLRSADLDAIREQYADTVELEAWFGRERIDPRLVADLGERLAGPVSEPVPRDETFAVAGSLGEPEIRSGSERTTESDYTAVVDLYAERVEAAKLAAVAEFAAGASHEINNPLAVISGHSQYLLKQEADEGRREALQSIVRQTRRIHAVLNELMLFARPPEPQPEWLELGRLVRSAVTELAPLAAERQVEMQTGHHPTSLWVEADPKQLSIALAALVRNGIEAAPLGGWVRVSTTFRPDRLDVVVEDSGPGPDERSRAHLFDPFYSGRAAGRGRGLGLPAAWRLARENGGEVRYVPVPGGPTRFVLTLPAAAVAHGAQRKSA